MVALSTCDTGKWLSLEKWVVRGLDMTSDQRTSSSNYETSGAINQQNYETGTGTRLLRQTQRRLTAKQVADMCQKYQNGATVYELGSEFGIDRRTVSIRLKRAGEVIRQSQNLKKTHRGS